MNRDDLKFAQNLFSLQNVVVIPATTLIGKRQPILGMPTDQAPDEPDFISALGTPVYGSITLGSTDPNQEPQNEYTGIDGNTYTFDSITLQTAIVVANLKKNIIRTSIQGRPGRIKEYIAMDDYDVTIHGVFDNTNGVAPKTDIALLHQVAKAEMSIPVTNYFLNLLGVYYITIEEVSYPQEQGRYS